MENTLPTLGWVHAQPNNKTRCKQRMEGCENALKRISGPQRGEVTGGCGYLHRRNSILFTK
jgi:hypothetical protein